MNLIKRFTTSITATLDNAVGHLENHDAIVLATIKETRQSVARTKARINTLRQQQGIFEAQLKDAAEQTKTWENRARELAESDPDKAMQCLRRRNQYQQEEKRLQESVLQQQRLISKVEGNLQKLQAKLEDIQHKHNLLRSRQSVADVNKAVASVDRDQDLQDTFERWESMVLEHELTTDEGLAADPLEQEFAKSESEAELRAQLAELKIQAGENNHE